MPKQAYIILLIQLQGLGLGILEQTKTYVVHWVTQKVT